MAGDVLKVNRGFANNYLAPQGLGEPASAEQIAAFEVKLAERAAAEAAAFDAAAAAAASSPLLYGTSDDGSETVPGSDLQTRDRHRRGDPGRTQGRRPPGQRCHN